MWAIISFREESRMCRFTLFLFTLSTPSQPDGSVHNRPGGGRILKCKGSLLLDIVHTANFSFQPGIFSCFHSSLPLSTQISVYNSCRSKTGNSLFLICFSKGSQKQSQKLVSRSSAAISNPAPTTHSPLHSPLHILMSWAHQKSPVYDPHSITKSIRRYYRS